MEDSSEKKLFFHQYFVVLKRNLTILQRSSKISIIVFSIMTVTLALAQLVIYFADPNNQRIQFGKLVATSFVFIYQIS